MSAQLAVSRVLGAVLRACATVAICAGSIGLAIIAFPLADYRSADGDSVRDETVAVLSRTTRQTTPAAVELEWSASRQQKVGDASGKITDVLISAGVPLKCGEPVVGIDGAARLAMCGEVPPWRDVTANTKGPDADQLAELLVSRGLLSENDRSNGARRAAAWRQFSRYVGLPATGVFQPSDVVWIGKATTPSRVTVQVGDRVSSDSVLFEVIAQLQAATVDTSGAGPVPAGDWVFSIDGSPVEFPIVAGSLDSREFEAMARSSVTEAGADLPTRIQGIMRRATSVSYDAIPPSAVVTAPDGSTCVVLAKGGTTAITVVESVTGLVMVIADLSEGTAVLDRPPAGTTC